MSKQEDKKYWYGGKLHNCLIDPATEDIRKIISSLIENDSRVIDVECGTVTLALFLSKNMNMS
ncbi:MAG: hypothetical protein RBS85_00910 [Methanofastidiosum sp.]|jgi:hypothetical protein|nr:hypothetical protein [Methanofastidiosum sp.]